MFFTHAEISQWDAVVQFTIRMPGETLGAAEDVLVQCDGRVVRSSQEGSGRIVAVAIDEYRSSGSKPSEAVGSCAARVQEIWSAPVQDEPNGHVNPRLSASSLRIRKLFSVRA